MMNEATTKIRRGMYETDWGNICFVAGPNAKSAWDIDGQVRIPIECVNFKKFVRPAKNKDD